MRTKLVEKQKAILLRKQGYSLNEISLNLNISKGTASMWLQDITLSIKAQKRIEKRSKQGRERSRVTRLAHTESKLEEATHLALETLSSIPLTKNLSRLHCSLLYWCEGEKSKNDKTLSFNNSDPILIQGFLRTLRTGFEIEESKFRVCVHLHSYHDPKKQLIFWSKVTNIPLTQFTRPYQKANSGKNIRLGYAGCASVRYHDVRIARQVYALARAFLKKGL